MINDYEKIYEKLGDENTLIQLAEESSELSQACLKLVRAKRGLTPVCEDVAVGNVIEEIADVFLCMNIIDIMLDNMYNISLIEREDDIEEAKLRRWLERLDL